MNAELEKIIAEHLAAGEPAAAATAAIQTLGPQILGYIAATMRDDDAANDVFGHFSEELWKSIGTFRAESSFKTWAYKIVMHSISRYRRDGFRKRKRPFQTGEASAIAAQVRSRTAPFRRTEVKDKIARLRALLEPAEQTLLFLRVDQGLSWNEVADVMSAGDNPVDAAALRKRFERAKTRLRKLAEQEDVVGE